VDIEEEKHHHEERNWDEDMKEFDAQMRAAQDEA